MIGRAVYAIVVYGAWVLLALASLALILAGLEAETVFQETALFAGLILAGILLCSLQIEAAAERRRTEDARRRDHDKAVQRQLSDLIVAATHPENRAELSRCVERRATSRKSHQTR